ncbi:histidine--tRNA ligase [Robiginitalea aurantiaca]|uniref:Histidine--tRNA ligase n=1 Tax=Robiginitalea aurantiaca TaxID=3056915 RepID=A0ABT7WC81_9FLAO|nr:histidine--tRNA ligase [Robiginitalea aurantiaca]MDM9630526.1 histidine--tRNA ligase [Robiginitalea aurantiaca]
MAQKPSIPKGTRDFNPLEVSKRNYIIEIIRKHFERFGYQPIETPAMENRETLMGKYGEEGDRLIFKILNSGDFVKKVTPELWEQKDSGKLTPVLTEKALRYDLTVPFARFVVMHQNDIDFPFKRYQIQPVWRADRPQKGRFREFYQCDADVVGARGAVQELEFIQLYDRVFSDLGLKGVTVKVNNRKILSGIAEVIGAPQRLTDFTVALDKLDKIGREKVEAEMIAKGIPEASVRKAAPLFDLQGSASRQLESLKAFLSDSSVGMQGVSELEFLLLETERLGLHTASCQMDITLARGLNYYTGAIFEVSAPSGVTMGSIGGGGRYDDLTGIFGLQDVSGVGISFGLDRIYLVMEELGLFPSALSQTLEVFCLNFGAAESRAALKLIMQLRDRGIRADMYPDDVKVAKQFKYADKREVPFVVLIGDEELRQSQFTVKDMKTGHQESYPMEDWQRFAARLRP